MSDSQEENIDIRDGESDLSIFEVENVPEPPFLVRQVGEEPEVRWRYDHEERGHPTPEMFDRLSHIEVKLVTMATDLEGEADEAAMAAHDALVQVREVMMDQRGLEGDDRQLLSMGNLDALPEVERR